MEEQKADGNIEVIYELIAGERRLRASRMAGLAQVPCIIRIGDDNREKLELAIIENVVRSDLNAVERALAYQRLADEFKLSWTDIGKKVSKSREYVSNTVRILMLPQDILEALSKGKISEGHTRPLLMLVDRPDEQMTLFKEMLLRKMTVREAEGIARRVAFDKVRKKSTFITPEVVEMEENLAESLGTRVTIEPREKGGKISIDYFTYDELMAISRLIKNASFEKTHVGMMESIKRDPMNIGGYTPEPTLAVEHTEEVTPYDVNSSAIEIVEKAEDDRSRDEIAATDNIDSTKDIEEDMDLYDMKRFSL
jgi:ParB family chromosome partitioning protein